MKTDPMQIGGKGKHISGNNNINRRINVANFRLSTGMITFAPLLQTIRMKRILTILFAFCCAAWAMAQDSVAVAPAELVDVIEPADSVVSDSAVVASFPRLSLLTCSPGVEIYEQYGHTALRYEDPANHMDIVFNYGLFSFEAPHFAWRFCLGKTDYIVGAEEYPYFEREYLERGSSVTVQVLDLKPDEVAHFWQLITTNCLPQNRTYRYNFLYKNCSTMARDIAYQSLATPLQFVPSDEVTLRSILHEHNMGYPWASFGIDLVLGTEVDRPVAHDVQEFAPSYLKDALAVATREGKPFVKETSVVGPTEPLPETFTFPLTPVQTMIVVLLLTAIICTLELLHHNRHWWYDVLLFGLQGIAGIVISFLFFFSGHPAVDSNVLVVLFNPIIFVLIPFIIKQRRRRRFPWAALTELLLIVALIVVDVIAGQFVPTAAWIFVGALFLRTVHHLLYSFIKK